VRGRRLTLVFEANFFMALKETVVSESGEKMPIFDITCFRDSVRYDLG